jgi:hypothetical protein
LSVKFTIEIYGADSKVLHRTIVVAINPLIARKKAVQLFVEWEKRKAAGVRVLNAHGETLYSWTE